MVGTTTVLEFKWTVSRGRDTYGYNICTLYADGRKVAKCNGGGYDMEGTVLGRFISTHYADRLLQLTADDMPPQSHYEYEYKKNGEPKLDRHGRRKGHTVDDGRYFYGLSYINPNYDPGKAKLAHAPVFGTDADVGKTVEQAEADGTSLGLERVQEFWKATSKHPTPVHTVPSIDGACGIRSVEDIAKAIGLSFKWVPTRSKNQTIRELIDER